MQVEKHFAEISELMEQARNKTLSIINRELIELYWQIGEYISSKCENSGWGKNVVKNLADYLNTTSPDLKGFSSQNIWRMKQFCECYKDNEKLSSLLRVFS